MKQQRERNQAKYTQQAYSTILFNIHLLIQLEIPSVTDLNSILQKVIHSFIILAIVLHTFPFIATYVNWFYILEQLSLCYWNQDHWFSEP